MTRNPAAGPVVDPDLVWWRSGGPVSVRRDPTPPEVVRRRVREEDEHVRRYMAAMDVRFCYTCDGSFSLGIHRPRLRNCE